MYMCYLDESGGLENAGTSHFVLTGFAVLGDQWKIHEQVLQSEKGKYGLRDEEIHTAWMARRFHEQEQIPDFEALNWADRRKLVIHKRDAVLLRIAAHGTAKKLRETKLNFRKTFPYIHLTRNERLTLLRQLADIIGNWIDARLFAEVVDKRHVYSVGGPAWYTFEYAFTEVVQRFEYFLRHKGRARNETLSGLLIQDNNETMSKKLTALMRKFHKDGTKWTNIDHIIETPLFVDSHLTSMVQMSDLCGYAIRRFFENGETDLFDRIYPRADRSSRGMVGIRHFTSPGCTCRICADHT